MHIVHKNWKHFVFTSYQGDIMNTFEEFTKFWFTKVSGIKVQGFLFITYSIIQNIISSEI